MPVYQNQGPQQYAMHQQNRKDDWIRQLLQMFMMKQRQGRQDERWEQEHELSQRRTKAYETQAETQRKQAEKPGKPSAFYEKFITAYQIFGGDAKLAYQKATDPTWEPPKTSERIEEESAARARGAGTGKFAPPKGITPTSKATAAESLRRYNIKRDEDKIAAQVSDDEAYMKNTISRFSKERERMYTALGKLTNDERKREQQANISHMDQALALLDGLDATIKPMTPLSKEAYDKAVSILANKSSIQKGLYDFATGDIMGVIKEKAIPKDMRHLILVDDQTGDRKIFMDSKWYKILN